MAQEAARRGAGNLAEFLGEESQVLVNRHAMQAFTEGCQSLERRLRDLEQRVAGFEGRSGKGA